MERRADAGSERRPPAEIAAEVEDLTRAILGDAACGHLGTELRTTADEILLGEGLQVGEGGAPDTRGETAEWDPAADPIEDFDPESLEDELEHAMGEDTSSRLRTRREPVEPELPEHGFVRAQNLIHELGAETDEPEFEWEEPIPSAEREPHEPAVYDEEPFAEEPVAGEPVEPSTTTRAPRSASCGPSPPRAPSTS